MGKYKARQVCMGFPTTHSCPTSSTISACIAFILKMKNLPIQYKPTTVEDWTRSDLYHNSFLIPHDEALEAANRNCEANGLPEIAVTAAQGKFLSLLARSMGAKRILEVGTLGGYA